MSELDIIDRLSIHRTMSQYLTGSHLIMALDNDRLLAKKEIERLRTELSELRKQQAEAVANSATVCNVFEAFGAHYDDSLSPADNVRSLIERQAVSVPEATKPNDKYTFVFPDASMTKIRFIFVDGEMVYENLEPEQ